MINFLELPIGTTFRILNDWALPYNRIYRKIEPMLIPEDRVAPQWYGQIYYCAEQVGGGFVHFQTEDKKHPVMCEVL